MRSIVCAAATALAATLPTASLAVDSNPQTALPKSAKASDTSRDSGPNSGKSTAAAPPEIVIFPPLLVVDAKFSNGCWARFYSDHNFAGETLTLGGAGNYAYFNKSYARLARKWDSVEIGPKATLTAYGDEQYKRPVATFKPAQRVAELDDKLGFLENIRSMRLRCAK